MRKLFSFNMISLDGFFEGPDRDINWHKVDDEFNEFAIEQTSSVAALLFGRVTYQLMESYWPTPDALKNDPVIAGLMNSLPKIVFSRTLEKVDWNNSRLVRENISEEITSLKKQTGKDVAVFGSANLLFTLMELDLVDEHRVMINPVLLGKGNSLFGSLKDRVNLRLLKSRTFKSGNILLYYEPVRKVHDEKSTK
jgi:dihydrofolate reductase